MITVAFTYSSYAQWVGNVNINNTNTGNVGIGTTTPMQKLSVSNNGAEGLEVYLGSPVGLVGLQSYNRVTNTYSRMQFDASNFTFSKGNVGIGTSNPMQKFAVSNNEAEGLEIYLGSPVGVVGLQSFNRAANVYSKMQFVASNFAFTSGNVGIGTTDTKGYAFAVNGDAVANSVTVKMYPWADYVFDKSYHLMPLAEVKSYIAVNSRLPEMPSEKEIAEKGLNLGDINKLLTKKVEELTLYLIEKDTKIKEMEQKQQMETQKQNEINQNLQKQLTDLQNHLIKG